MGCPAVPVVLGELGYFLDVADPRFVHAAAVNAGMVRLAAGDVASNPTPPLPLPLALALALPLTLTLTLPLTPALPLPLTLTLARRRASPSMPRCYGRRTSPRCSNPTPIPSPHPNPPLSLTLPYP